MKKLYPRLVKSLEYKEIYVLIAWISIYQQLAQLYDIGQSITFNEVNYDVKQFKYLHLLSCYIANSISKEERLKIEHEIDIPKIREEKLREGINCLQQLPHEGLSALYISGQKKDYCQRLFRHTHSVIVPPSSSDAVWFKSNKRVTSEVLGLSLMLDDVILVSDATMNLIQKGSSVLCFQHSYILWTIYLLESIPEISLSEIIMSLHLYDKKPLFVEKALHHLNSPFFTHYVHQVIEMINKGIDRIIGRNLIDPLANYQRDVEYLINQSHHERYLDMSTTLALKLFRGKIKHV